MHWRWSSEELSQSLFHQVCVRSPVCMTMRPVLRRNPFFIRSVFVLRKPKKLYICESQSLFHQVCVRSWPKRRKNGGSLSSQSLFHQVCVRSPQG